ncbi:MAG: arsenate reductase family protein [Flavobacteriales bacterium]
MMKKAYHLAQCSTCQRILIEVNWKGQLQDIRTEKISAEQLDQMAKMSGSYESLFSRRAMKYKIMGLKDKALGEADYRQLILEEDTFLKRPVFIVNDKIFVGNSKKTTEALSSALNE